MFLTRPPVLLLYQVGLARPRLKRHRPPAAFHRESPHRRGVARGRCSEGMGGEGSRAAVPSRGRGRARPAAPHEEPPLPFVPRRAAGRPRCHGNRPAGCGGRKAGRVAAQDGSPRRRAAAWARRGGRGAGVGSSLPFPRVPVRPSPGPRLPSPPRRRGLRPPHPAAASGSGRRCRGSPWQPGAQLVFAGAPRRWCESCRANASPAPPGQPPPSPPGPAPPLPPPPPRWLWPCSVSNRRLSPGAGAGLPAPIVCRTAAPGRGRRPGGLPQAGARRTAPRPGGGGGAGRGGGMRRITRPPPHSRCRPRRGLGLWGVIGE